MIILISSLEPKEDIKNVNISKINTHDPAKLDRNILSENEKMSYVIKKNPKTGMIKRKLHEGEISGYYYGKTVSYYVMYFHDYNGVSYETNNIYLNPNQYTSPQAILNIVSEIMSAHKKEWGRS